MRTSAATLSWTAPLGLACWAVQPLSIVLEVVVAAAVDVPYSWVDNTISDLGARSCTTVAYPGLDVPVCSPRHQLLNAGFVVGGVTTAAGAWLLLRRASGGLARLPVALWTLFGLSSVLTGLVPLDVDLELHYLVSTPAVLLGGIAVAVTARLLGRRGWRGAGPWVAVGLVSTLASLGLTVRLDPSWGGLLERVGFWPGSLALAVFAWVLRPGRPRATSVRPSSGTIGA